MAPASSDGITGADPPSSHLTLQAKNPFWTPMNTEKHG
jgi:hypothetical protein